MSVFDVGWGAREKMEREGRLLRLEWREDICKSGHSGSRVGSGTGKNGGRVGRGRAEGSLRLAPRPRQRTRVDG